MNASSARLRQALTAWLESEPAVHAAVLYGSSARAAGAVAAADSWSDIDLHVITSEAERLEHADWAQQLVGQGFCHRAARPAAGGVRKVRLLFAAGEVEMVLMPVGRMRSARLAVRLGLHRRAGAVRDGLNVLSTGLSSGYRFLKGEPAWGKFYARVAAELPGLRMTDEEIRQLADLFVCDLLSCFQRIERGEWSAAQRALHRLLAETNFTLVRELRLRRGLPVPSFEPARRVEMLLAPQEMAWVRVDARFEPEALRGASWQAFAGLKALMAQLDPEWKIAAGVDALLAPFEK